MKVTLGFTGSAQKIGALLAHVHNYAPPEQLTILGVTPSDRQLTLVLDGTPQDILGVLGHLEDFEPWKKLSDVREMSCTSDEFEVFTVGCLYLEVLALASSYTITLTDRDAAPALPAPSSTSPNYDSPAPVAHASVPPGIMEAALGVPPRMADAHGAPELGTR